MFGSDSFTFRVNDGEFDSPPATVSLTVFGENDVPDIRMAEVVNAFERTRSWGCRARPRMSISIPR